MKNNSPVKIILIFVFLLTALLNTDAETKKIVFSEFYPYEYMDKDQAKGINVYLISQVCKKMGITPVFCELPWKRALRNVQTGEADAVFSLFKTEERENIFIFSETSLNTVKMSLFTNRSSTLAVKSIEDLKGLKIGVYRGSSYGKVFDNFRSCIKDPANSNKQIIEKQVRNRTDIFIMDENVADYWIKKLNYTEIIKPLDFTLITQDTYIAFSKSSDIDTDKFSSIIEEEKRKIRRSK